MKTRQDKPCQWSGCAHNAVPTERFCTMHRNAMLQKMEADGYLEPLPSKTPKRDSAKKEVRRETKWGVDR